MEILFKFLHFYTLYACFSILVKFYFFIMLLTILNILVTRVINQLTIINVLSLLIEQYQIKHKCSINICRNNVQAKTIVIIIFLLNNNNNSYYEIHTSFLILMISHGGSEFQNNGKNLYLLNIYIHIKIFFEVLHVSDWLNKLRTWREFILKYFLRGPKKCFSAGKFIVRKEVSKRWCW